ncbi:MAG: PcfJ domain-containing protein, partial [Saprospiraceae bacterium]|nr:PcfJ domain-containing protein [Saprospiraceae bacterium]
SNLRVLIRFFKTNHETLSSELISLGAELIMRASPDFVGQKSNVFLREFLSAILPHFEARFVHRMDKETLFRYPGKILTWWKVWYRHQSRTEETLKEDVYYQTDFSTIIKYVPEYIWWNNGLSYGRNNRMYHFQSPEFRHLAVGGSVRKGPDFRPYTRRMAKAFVTLPYNFPAGMRDMYLYFYGISLGAGELLLLMMQRFMRHRPNRTHLLTELELWNPVLQKLACADFENLDIPEARSLMGYLYHCLRDQPDYQVKSRTIAQLYRDSQAYLDRIQARAAARTAREQARLLMTGKRSKLVRWAAHPSVLPMEIKQADRHYKIVELTDENQLSREGAVMNHCVGGYTYKCTDECGSIWSLREYLNGAWYSLVTIELQERQIVQARGPFNATPTAEQRKLIRAWKRRENLV